MKLFLDNFQEGREDGTKGRSRRLTLGETSSQEIINSKQTKQSEPEKKERWRGEQELDNWQRVEAAFAARQAAQLELKAPLRHNEDVAAN